MRTFKLYFAAAVLGALLPVSGVHSAPFEKPNILLIVADDLGVGDIGCFGSRDIKTPNVDRLAETGVRLTQCYSAAPVCTPTRAALLTGVYQQRLGRHFDWVVGGLGDDSGLPPGTVTLPQMLKANGYATGMAGKWHIGGVESRAPNAFGFELFKGLRGGNLDYWTYTDNLGRLDLWNNTEPFTGQAGYLTDLIGDWSIDFIEQNAENPFFLYVAFTAPHWPYQGKEPELRNNNRESYEKAGGTQQIFNSMVETMDQNIGRIIDALDAAGLTEKTLVVFTSDNGGVPPFANNGSLRGYKATLYEGGIRVPGILNWRGKLPAGQESDQPVITMDFTETILAATATPRPDAALPPDGINMLPILSGEKPAEDRPLFWLAKHPREDTPFWRALRVGDFKFLQINEDRFLYNLKNDPQEEHNLFQTLPEKGDQFVKMVGQWEASLPPRNAKK
jgi:arylsulfatase A-like enzyme